MDRHITSNLLKILKISLGSGSEGIIVQRHAAMVSPNHS
jgi:hypothetical protein